MLQCTARRLLGARSQSNGALLTRRSIITGSRRPNNTTQTLRRWQPIQEEVSRTARPFASLSQTVAQESNPLANVQKELWEFYVSTGRGANALFQGKIMFLMKVLKYCCALRHRCSLMFFRSLSFRVLSWPRFYVTTAIFYSSH